MTTNNNISSGDPLGHLRDKDGLLPGEKSIDFSPVTEADRIFMENHDQSMSAPWATATNNDPSTMDASIANDRVDKGKAELNEITSSREKYDAEAKAKADTAELTPKTVEPKVVGVGTENATSEIKTLDSEIATMEEHAKDVDREGSEFTEEEKTANIEKEHEIKSKRETYQDQIKILTENDSYYQEMSASLDAVKTRLAVGYEDHPEVTALLKAKEEGLAEQKQWNERVEQISKTNMYHTGSFRYQTSSAIEYIKEQQQASADKLDTLSAKYDAKVIEAKVALRDGDIELFDKYMQGVRDAKGDISKELQDSVRFELDMNKEARDNQKFILDMSAGSMDLRESQAEQLGQMMAMNPASDPRALAKAAGFLNPDGSVDVGLLGLAQKYSYETKQGFARTQSLIDSSNRSNIRKDTSTEMLNKQTAYYAEMEDANGNKLYTPITAKAMALKDIQSLSGGGAVSGDEQVTNIPAGTRDTIVRGIQSNMDANKDVFNSIIDKVSGDTMQLGEITEENIGTIIDNFKKESEAALMNATKAGDMTSPEEREAFIEAGKEIIIGLEYLHKGQGNIGERALQEVGSAASSLKMTNARIAASLKAMPGASHKERFD
ncbi:MAG: hypothetical protein U9O94_05755 [Nanoarchaeota archaeon]|nr:hypothetical protein [Nanoarchaeota archaeon]